eukprot:2824136-Lingulodinium_polyedra.AAC.1
MQVRPTLCSRARCAEREHRLGFVPADIVRSGNAAVVLMSTKVVVVVLSVQICEAKSGLSRSKMHETILQR